MISSFCKLPVVKLIPILAIENYKKAKIKGKQLSALALALASGYEPYHTMGSFPPNVKKSWLKYFNQLFLSILFAIRQRMH